MNTTFLAFLFVLRLFVFMFNACSLYFLTHQGHANRDDESTPIIGLETHRTAGQTFQKQGADERAISKAALNEIIGTTETYDSKVTMEVYFCFYPYPLYHVCMETNLPFLVFGVFWVK